MKIMLQHDETGRLLGWNEETGPIPYGYSVVQSPPKPTIAAPSVPVAVRNTPETEQAYRSQRTRLLTAVAMAAEVLHAANQLEMSQAAMNDRWRALEDALNEWRAGK